MTTKGQVLEMICYLAFIREFAVSLTPLSPSCFSRKLHLLLRAPSRVSIEAKFIGVAGSFWQTVAKQGLAFQTNKQPVEPAGLNSITQLSSQFTSVRLCSALLSFVLFFIRWRYSIIYWRILLGYGFVFIWFLCHCQSIEVVFWGMGMERWMDGWMDAASHKLYTQHNSDWGGIAPIFGEQMIKSTSLWWVASSAL